MSNAKEVRKDQAINSVKNDGVKIYDKQANK